MKQYHYVYKLTRTEYDRFYLEQRNAELQETINKLLLEKSKIITQQSC